MAEPTINIALHDGPIPPTPPVRASGAGAVLRFDGVVRLTEAGRRLVALDYEAYEPMTTIETTRLAREVAAEYGLARIDVTHSVGRVPVDQCSFRLDVAAAHRAEAIAATDAFIRRLKAEVPLWKVAVFE